MNKTQNLNEMLSGGLWFLKVLGLNWWYSWS